MGFRVPRRLSVWLVSESSNVFGGHSMETSKQRGCLRTLVTSGSCKRITWVPIEDVVGIVLRYWQLSMLFGPFLSSLV